MKRLIAVFILITLLFSCSPSKTEYNTSETLSAEQVPALIGDTVYGPKEIYELNALDEDFLDQSVLLPYYKDKTAEQLKEDFINNPALYDFAYPKNCAVLPENVCFGNGNFLYDKLTGGITRTCKDPQCRHFSKAMYGLSGKCPLINSRWQVSKDRLYTSVWDFTTQDMTAINFTSDFSFSDYYYCTDLPKASAVRAVAEDGDLILEKQEYVSYIDENGVQKRKYSSFEMLKFDPATGGTKSLYRTESVCGTDCIGGAVFCRPAGGDPACVIYDNYTKTAYIENAKRVLTFFENKICYSDSATGEAICFDVHTGEKAKWAYKDSPLTKIYTSFYCGGKLYFTRYFSADELTGSNLFDESQARAALKAADAGEYGFYIPVVFRCNTDGSDIEPVYYVHGYNIWNITVDGEVMYLYGYTATGGDRFVAYDMSSGVELRISVPISEYHYPGEYDYDENWLSGFRW